MAAQPSVSTPPQAPLWGELRYSGELVRLLADPALYARPRRGAAASPVLLIPGFMAGDNSLSVMRGWMRRRGHPVLTSGIRINVDCAERIVARLQEQLRAFSAAHGQPVFLVGQSRGGALARSLAVREPRHVCGLMMLGTPVCDWLAVTQPVLRTVRLVARLGDLGVPRLLSSGCASGDCCADFRADMRAPLHPHVHALAVHSRSDGIVDWRACLDPHAEPVEIDSSHCGMSVHAGVYRVLARVLDDCAGPALRQAA